MIATPYSSSLLTYTHLTPPESFPGTSIGRKITAPARPGVKREKITGGKTLVGSVLYNQQCLPHAEASEKEF